MFFSSKEKDEKIRKLENELIAYEEQFQDIGMAIEQIYNIIRGLRNILDYELFKDECDCSGNCGDCSGCGE
jgi:flagellin-specific chaperone FliS